MKHHCQRLNPTCTRRSVVFDYWISVWISCAIFSDRGVCALSSFVSVYVRAHMTKSRSRCWNQTLRLCAGALGVLYLVCPFYQSLVLYSTISRCPNGHKRDLQAIKALLRRFSRSHDSPSWV